MKRLNREFEEVNEILKKQAKSALDIQIFATQYLEEFRKSSGENLRNSKIAIWLSLSAILAATIIPLGIFLHSQLYEKPTDQEVMQEAISALISNKDTRRVNRDGFITEVRDGPITPASEEESLIENILNEYSEGGAD